MVRIIVDQSYGTHVQTGIITYADHYARSQTQYVYWTDQVQSGDHVLLEDDMFDRVITTLSWYEHESVTVSQFKALVLRELTITQKIHHSTTQLMTFLITDTTVNGKILQVPWGHTGLIRCSVQVLLVKSKLLPKHIVTQCKSGLIRLFPKTLYTIEYMNTKGSYTDYVLLYLMESSVKCVIVSRHQYQGIYYLNWGLRDLKGLMKELNVEGYYRVYDQQHINHLTRKLINQSVSDYTRILGKWLQQYVASGSTVLMINSTGYSPMIHEQCISFLSTECGFYVMDCTQQLPRIGRYGDPDAQVYCSLLS